MNKTFLTLTVHASLMVLSVGEALAADPHHNEAEAIHIDEHGVAEAVHGAEHHASSGLPQMDPTWFPSQIFWLAVTFTCLYIIFSKKVLPEISSVLENRREQIQGDLEEAQNLKEEAEKVHEAYDEILDGARNKSTALFDKVDEDVKAQADKKLEAFRKKSLKKTKETEEAIDSAKDAAMGEMHSIAAEVASQAAEKIVGVSTDLTQAESLVKNIGRKAA